MTIEKLTAKSVENWGAKGRKAGKRIEVADTGQPGLYLIVQSSGRTSWAVRYRRKSDGRPRKLTLDKGTLERARNRARDALNEVAEGKDPAAAKQIRRQQIATAVLVDDAFRAFLDNHRRAKGKGGRPIRESSRVETARLLGFKRDPKDPNAWIASGNGALAHWQGRTLVSITQSDVRDLLRRIIANGHPVSANRTLTALKTCFRWHVMEGTLAASPAANIDDPSPEMPRERVLSDDELTALWRAADNDRSPFGNMVKLLILTGVRRDEARDAPWKEFDEREWSIPGSRTKNGRAHVVPLASATCDLLKGMPRVGRKLLFTTNGETPISGLAKCKKRLAMAMAKELGHEPERWTLHDLRRTFATGWQKLGIRQEVTEVALNHAGGLVSGVAAIYGRHAYTEEKRSAMDAWAEHVTSIVSVPADKVVPFKQASHLKRRRAR
jgi:integrase